MTRIVFDTVVMVRALLNKRGPCGRLVFRHGQELEVIYSPVLLTELMDVLNRPRLTGKSPLFREVEMQQVLDLVRQATLVEPHERVVFERDPKDAPFLEACDAGKASYLVSEDKDLLSLGEYAGTRIVTCAWLLDWLERGP